MEKNAQDIMESKKDKHRNSGKSGQTRSLVSKIQAREAVVFGHIMRREGLECSVATGKLGGRRDMREREGERAGERRRERTGRESLADTLSLSIYLSLPLSFSLFIA